MYTLPFTKIIEVDFHLLNKIGCLPFTNKNRLSSIYKEIEVIFFKKGRVVFNLPKKVRSSSIQSFSAAIQSKTRYNSIGRTRIKIFIFWVLESNKNPEWSLKISHCGSRIKNLWIESRYFQILFSMANENWETRSKILNEEISRKNDDFAPLANEILLGHATHFCLVCQNVCNSHTTQFLL